MPTSLEVDQVRFVMSGGQLEDVEIGGREDIFSHPEVERFWEQGGKIVKITGVFILDGRKFGFTASYAPSTGIGRVSVEKKGKRTGDMEIRKEGFDIVYEKFEEYFIE